MLFYRRRIMTEETDVETITLSLSDLSLELDDDVEALHAQYNNLTQDMKVALYVSQTYLDTLIDQLLKSSYVPSTTRKFLCCLVDHLDPSSREHVSDIYENTSTRRYIGVAARRNVFRILLKWKDILAHYGETQESQYFFYSGEITPSFRDWILKNGFRCASRKPSCQSTFKIAGAVAKSDFETKLSHFDVDWQSCGIAFEYVTEEPMRDEKLKFGNPYSSSFVIDAYKCFPLQYHTYFACNGCGTVGAALNFQTKICAILVSARHR